MLSEEPPRKRTRSSRHAAVSADGEDEVVLVGHSGAQYLQRILATTSSPLEAIANFQALTALEAPQSSIVFELLQLHGMSNSDIHATLLQALLRDILDTVKSLSLPQLEALLKRTFSFISVPELQRIPLALLEAHPKLPRNLLVNLAKREDVYHVLPLCTKQQIWAMDESLFGKEAFSLFLEYADSVTAQCHNLVSKPASSPSRRRSENAKLVAICKSIGTSPELYQSALNLIRTYYADTGLPQFCLLRTELLMKFHDDGIAAIYSKDRSHKIAWLLDACVKEDAIEERQLKEIEVFLRGIKQSDKIWADLAMIIADPVALSMLTRNIYRTLKDVVERESIPKQDARLVSLSRLLALGMRASQIVRGEAKGGLDIDQDLLSEFYPLLAEIVLDNELREEGDEAEAFDERLGSVFIQNHPAARVICAYAALDRVVAGDYIAYRQWHQLFAQHASFLISHTGFVASLVGVLAASDNPVPEEEWEGIICDGLVPFAKDNIEWHQETIRLLESRTNDIPIPVQQKAIETLHPSSPIQDKADLITRYEALALALSSASDLQSLVGKTLEILNTPSSSGDQ